MVRSDRAIRRHWHLVCCAFSFCWQAWFAEEAGTDGSLDPPTQAEASAFVNSVNPAARGKNGGRFSNRHSVHRYAAGDAPPRARVAGSLDVALALVAVLVNRAPTSGYRGAPPRRRHRASTPLLPPGVTKYR